MAARRWLPRMFRALPFRLIGNAAPTVPAGHTGQTHKYTDKTQDTLTDRQCKTSRNECPSPHTPQKETPSPNPKREDQHSKREHQTWTPRKKSQLKKEAPKHTPRREALTSRKHDPTQGNAQNPSNKKESRARPQKKFEAGWFATLMHLQTVGFSSKVFSSC